VKPSSKSLKPTTARVTPSKSKKDASERHVSSPFFDQDNGVQQMIEDAWEDGKIGFRGSNKDKKL